MHDNRTSCPFFGKSSGLPTNRLFLLGSTLRLVVCLCLVAHGPLTAQVSFTTNIGSGTIYTQLSATLTNTQTVYLRKKDFTSWGYTPAGTGFLHNAATGSPLSSSGVAWTGNTSVNTAGMSKTTPIRTQIWEFNWTGSGVAAGQFEIVIPATNSLLLWGATGPGAFYHTLATVTITLPGPGQAAIVNNPNTAPPAPTRGELLMMLMNNTGLVQNIMWGDKMIELQPGMNQIRYDGQFDSSGFPAVRPSDFQGTLFTSPDGRQALAATINEGIERGIVWGLAPSTGPTALPLQDRIEIIRAPTSTTAGTMAVHHPSGMISIIGMPPLPAPTASNTTGGAVLSNPTLPKPPQTSTNTTNTVTNNITNNTSTTNSTIINNSGQGTETEASNLAEMNALTGSAGDWDQNAQQAQDAVQSIGDSLSGKQTEITDKVVSKFIGFKTSLSFTGVPKIMNYTQTLNLGNFGSHALTLDFNKMPFPPVRQAILVVIIMLFIVWFMQKITI